MSCIERFRKMFPGVTLEVEDLYLLEAFQIGYFPGWVPEREFAAVLWAYPSLRRFLVHKHPPIRHLVDRVMERFGPAEDAEALAACGQALVWTIADLVVYNRCPEVYDSLDFHGWDFREVTSVVALERKVVIDGGAGTGRVALAAAGLARFVFAVEPVGRLRRFIRDKASQRELDNLFVVDGFLHAIPFPDGFADVLITSHALGWQLEDELAEFQRVVEAGGTILHCPGTAEIEAEEPTHQRLISPDWGYSVSRFMEADGRKRKYWKRL
jgi:ubiquinone/menaquinone biosynthesis C-methylase UbiE